MYKASPNQAEQAVFPFILQGRVTFSECRVFRSVGLKIVTHVQTSSIISHRPKAWSPLPQTQRSKAWSPLPNRILKYSSKQWWGGQVARQGKVTMETWCYNVKGMVGSVHSKFHINWSKIGQDMSLLPVWRSPTGWKNPSDNFHEALSENHLCKIWWWFTRFVVAENINGVGLIGRHIPSLGSPKFFITHQKVLRNTFSDTQSPFSPLIGCGSVIGSSTKEFVRATTSASIISAP